MNRKFDLQVKSSTLLTLATGFIFLIVGAFFVLLVNYTMHRQALDEAEAKAEILLNRNLATHLYFSETVKPKLLEWSEPFRDENYFEPSWMSSSYAVRAIDNDFQKSSEVSYYIKDATINARSPENEATSYEKEFLEAVRENPELEVQTSVRLIDNQPYLVVLRPGEVFDGSCMLCHSDPMEAPVGLVEKYGAERGFHRENELGTISSVISIRIPLADAYGDANRFSLNLSGILLLLLGCLFAIHQVIQNRLVFGPLENIRQIANNIFVNPAQLGKTIPKPFTQDLADLVETFNLMFVKLREGRDELEDQVIRRTSALATTNKALQHEIGERKQAEEKIRSLNLALEQRVKERTNELRAANAALERASRLKDEFLASMSHELRTPLTGILSVSEILQEQVYGPLSDKQNHYLHIIEESGRHLLSMINDILDLFKIEAGQLRLDPALTSMNEISRECLQGISVLASEKNQSVHFSISPDDIVVYVDPRRFRQILINLLSNAVKYSPPGQKIGLDIYGDDQAQIIHMTVWDTGIGIAQEDFPRLFLPFTQLDGSLSRQHGGTGLGLAIVYRLAEKLGGSISLESTPGRGSRFTVHIPWVKEKHTHRAEPKSSLDAGSQNQVNPAALAANGKSALRILLAEDNLVNGEVYKEYLDLNGYEVTWVLNGKEALEVVQQEQPHLILMDIQMPGMDGITAIRQIRALKDEHLAHIPVIALTALAMTGDRERCLEAGADEYLSKPIGLKELLRNIQAFTHRPGELDQVGEHHAPPED